MSKIGDINWETNPQEFLNPEETKDLAQQFNSGNLSNEANELIENINAEIEKGLSPEALSINGRSPLNDIALEIVSKLKVTVLDFYAIGEDSISNGNEHTMQEVHTYFDETIKEYNKRKIPLRKAVSNYNTHRTIKTGSTASNGTPETEELPKIELINGEDGNYEKVIISGTLSSKSAYYTAVKNALTNVEKMYPAPTTAYKYKSMWGYLETSKSKDIPKSKEDDDGWKSYEDAFMAGFNNILTPEEFAKERPEGYANYQEYLDAMYKRYLAYKQTLKYQPEIKEGAIDTKLYNNDKKGYDDTIQYEGRYLEYYNEDGIKVTVPLAIAKYENGKIVYVPMTKDQETAYINKVTHYYNDIMKSTDVYSDKLKKELGKRVDSLSMVYIDPNSKEQIQAAEGAAAYCARTGKYSNHSDIVVFSNQFINLEDHNDIHNTQKRYDYMIRAYTHENGHAYANNRLLLRDRDTNDTWNNIYNQVSGDEINKEILRDYSVSNKKELFADSTDYYYNEPERLKQVEIDVEANGKKYNTLYDYMDYVLN